MSETGQHMCCPVLFYSKAAADKQWRPCRFYYRNITPAQIFNDFTRARAESAMIQNVTRLMSFAPNCNAHGALSAPVARA